MAVQSVLFSADPWAIMRQCIRTSAPTAAKPEALALLEQAQDYYRAATSADTFAAKPVLLYYCYLNAVKAFLLHRSRRPTYEKALHGLSESLGPGARELTDALLTAHPSVAGANPKVNVFDDLISEITGAGLAANRIYPVPQLLPQIVTGHRLWISASGENERFVAIERVELVQGAATKELWANLVLDRGDVTRLGYSLADCLNDGQLAPNWHNVVPPATILPVGAALFESVATTAYGQHPSQVVGQVASALKSKLWTTILSVPPYRRYYIHLSPAAELPNRLPQMLSMYALTYYLGSITRYRPHHFDRIIATEFGGFIQSFLQEQPTQFLYLLASEFAAQEVTKPALA